jgi:hypothetical protein
LELRFDASIRLEGFLCSCLNGSFDLVLVGASSDSASALFFFFFEGRLAAARDNAPKDMDAKLTFDSSSSGSSDYFTMKTSIPVDT